jgi:hypothetical protein
MYLFARRAIVTVDPPLSPLHAPCAVTDVTQFPVFEILLYRTVAILLLDDRATHGD